MHEREWHAHGQGNAKWVRGHEVHQPSGDQRTRRRHDANATPVYRHGDGASLRRCCSPKHADLGQAHA